MSTPRQRKEHVDRLAAVEEELRRLRLHSWGEGSGGGGGGPGYTFDPTYAAVYFNPDYNATFYSGQTTMVYDSGGTPDFRTIFPFDGVGAVAGMTVDTGYVLGGHVGTAITVDTAGIYRFGFHGNVMEHNGVNGNTGGSLGITYFWGEGMNFIANGPGPGHPPNNLLYEHRDIGFPTGGDVYVTLYFQSYASKVSAPRQMSPGNSIFMSLVTTSGGFIDKVAVGSDGNEEAFMLWAERVG